jgi:hypothetical protein
VFRMKMRPLLLLFFSPSRSRLLFFLFFPIRARPSHKTK